MAATIAVGSRNAQSTGVSGGTIPSDLFIRDVPDWVDKLERRDVPLSKMIGSEGAPSMPMNKAEWGWGSPDPYADTITEAIGTTDGTSITVANADYYQVTDVILIDSEELRVTAVNTDTNVLTVVRGHAGTTAATHLDNAAVYITGPAVVESADDADSPYTQGEVDHNFHRISTFTWSMSKRAEVTPTYEHRSGQTFSAELRKKMEETAPLRFELMLLLSQRAQGTGSTPSQFGGLRQSSYITTRSDLSDAILTETDLMSNLQTVHNLVGPSLMPDTLVCSPIVARIISSWYNETRRSSPSDNKMSVRWTEIDTWFGPMKVVPHYLMTTVANDKIYIADFNRFAKRPYASGTGWQTGEHSTQGWHRRGFLRGDYTVLAPYCDARLEIYNFDVTAASYSGIS
jgi:hypothetical protein